MNTKSELIQNYNKAQTEFANLVVAKNDTPEPLKSSLIATYNNYLEWFRSVEKYAEQCGFYQELVTA